MVVYFTGTGNSRYVAQRIAAALGDELLSMNDRINAEDTSSVKTDERMVIVTPTCAWRIPRPVENWLRRTEFPGTKQAWFVMTCGGKIGNAAKYNYALCRKNNSPIWVQRRSSCRRITLPCSIRLKRRKCGRLLPRRSRTLTVQSPPLRSVRHSRRLVITSTTVS